MGLRSSWLYLSAIRDTVVRQCATTRQRSIVVAEWHTEKVQADISSGAAVRAYVTGGALRQVADAR